MPDPDGESRGPLVGQIVRVLGGLAEMGAETADDASTLLLELLLEGEPVTGREIMRLGLFCAASTCHHRFSFAANRWRSDRVRSTKRLTSGVRIWFSGTSAARTTPR